MADNILTTDRTASNIALAAKDVAGVLVPRNIITDTTGADITPLTDAALRATPVPAATNDGTGLAVNSLSSGTGQNGLMIAMGATNFVLSTANSTVAQLASGATFTGTIESIFNAQDISLLLTSDQPGTLTLNQYIDQAGTRKISAWPYAIAAGVPFSRCFVGNGNFFGLTFQNTGGSTTTTLNINTAYGTLGKATNLGNAPVSLNEVNGTVFSLGQTTSASSLPVSMANDSGSGTITTQNLVPAGAATAGSAVEITLNGASTLSIQTTGTYTGALSLQATIDGSAWVTLGGTPLININTGGYLASITSALQSVFQADVAGFNKARITGLAAVTGTATVTLRTTAGAAAMVALDTSLPAGANIIGAVTGSGTFTTTLPAAAAIADGTGTPTTPTVGATGIVFNGGSYDRVRGNINNNTGDTGAKTATGNGATQTNYNASGAYIVINMGAVTGTTPTLDAKIQVSADGGTTWVDLPGAAFPQFTATGVKMLAIYPGATVAANTAVSAPLPRTWRVMWTIGGTTPSFTITNIQVAHIL